MLCCLCHKREAKVHLSYSSDGPTAKAMEIIDLCEECARKHGVNDKAGFSLAALLNEVKKARQSPEWP
jgi:protein-arginine kinase activator protein McsA